jgi:hypothetical protein
MSAESERAESEGVGKSKEVKYARVNDLES